MIGILGQLKWGFLKNRRKDNRPILLNKGLKDKASIPLFVRFLFIFDLQFSLFRIALWSSVRKELSPWLFTCAVFILVPS